MILSVADKLRQAGLRPTSQRMVLANHLFRHGHKHVTAEVLHEAITTVGEKVALATVYNTLHQFTDAGLLRQIHIEAGKSYFDTNVTAHHHFYYEDENRLEDIPFERISVMLDGQDPKMTEPPKGMMVSQVDVIVRLRSEKA